MRQAALLTLTLFLVCCTPSRQTMLKDIDAPAFCGDNSERSARQKESRAPHSYRQDQLDTGQVDLTKKTAMIYYAVDSEEPYMQWAVDRDLRSLRIACELTRDQQKRSHVNWIAFVNSHLRHHNAYLLCQGGDFSEVTYDSGFVTDADLSSHELLT